MTPFVGVTNTTPAPAFRLGVLPSIAGKVRDAPSKYICQWGLMCSTTITSSSGRSVIRGESSGIG